MAPLQDQQGVWGKPSSTLDWCELNYVVTPYIAEFWNTISNLAMIIPPIVCAIYYTMKEFEIQYVLANLALLAVGVGSWMFHMTLQYEMQLLDELPMIYGTSVFLYNMHHHAKAPGVVGSGYITLNVVACAVITVVYLVWKYPVFHQACYGAMVLMLLYESVIATRRFPRIKPLVLASLLFFLLGLALWNIDNQFCPQLRAVRSRSWGPVGALTQLHAWWHLFTAYGTYLHIVFSTYVRSLHLKQNCSVKRLLGVWPYVCVDGKE